MRAAIVAAAAVVGLLLGYVAGARECVSHGSLRYFVVTAAVGIVAFVVSRWVFDEAKLRLATTPRVLRGLIIEAVGVLRIFDGLLPLMKEARKKARDLESKKSTEGIKSGFVVATPVFDLQRLVELLPEQDSITVRKYHDRCQRFRELESRYHECFPRLVDALHSAGTPLETLREYVRQVEQRLDAILQVGLELCQYACEICEVAARRIGGHVTDHGWLRNVSERRWSCLGDIEAERLRYAKQLEDLVEPSERAVEQLCDERNGQR